MARLPGHVEVRLRALGIYIERMGRGERGAPKVAERRWFFCGYYWHRGTKRNVNEGPFGPMPCWSAAAADALKTAEERQWRPDLRMLKPSERQVIDATDGSVFVDRRRR